RNRGPAGGESKRGPGLANLRCMRTQSPWGAETTGHISARATGDVLWRKLYRYGEKLVHDFATVKKNRTVGDLPGPWRGGRRGGRFETSPDNCQRLPKASFCSRFLLRDRPPWRGLRGVGDASPSR